jgi:sphinganine-1-phosphate aldolase
MEAEVLRMTITMLRGDRECAGSMTSGGTESIVMACLTYRNWAAATKDITEPEMVVPASAHPAFSKAAHYFGIKLVRVPVLADSLAADVEAMEAAITENTIALAGSSPGYPHGVIDDIPALAAMAQKHGIGMHSDACLGGFYLAWARENDDAIPDFDFSVPGVTSMSCDTHKYGYAVKGTSTVIYRSKQLRKFQYFVETEWSGGVYFSPTLAGSRCGALIACAWASLLAIGQDGFRSRAAGIHHTAAAIREGIRTGKAGPHVQLLGKSAGSSVLALHFPGHDPFELSDQMLHTRGWLMTPLHKPAGLHLCVTVPMTGREEEFLGSLRECAEYVATAETAEQSTMAPLYGLAAFLPDKGSVDTPVETMVETYLDTLTEDIVDGETFMGKDEKA